MTTIQQPGHEASQYVLQLRLRALGQPLTEAGAGVRTEAASAHSLVLWQRFGVTPNGPEIQLPEDGRSLYLVWAGPDEWHVDDRPGKGA